MNAALLNEAAVAKLSAEQLLAVNPLEFPGWDSLVSVHRQYSFFHGTTWAQVLHETYGHAPIYFCCISQGRLHALLPVMEVSSALTGRRGVSLPFSDFCRPLGEGGGAKWLYDAVMEYGKRREWRYLECRDASECWSSRGLAAECYCGHVIDLQGGEAALFGQLGDSARRAVRKAHRQGVRIEFSAAAQAISEFFTLHCATRRRHGLPPQPFRFFENIGRLALGVGQGFVAIARLKEKPLAAAIFFHSGTEAIYKFGASDFAFQDLRPNNLLMWECIKRCASQGFARLHLGRTTLQNGGLRRFKRGFGAREERIVYRRYDFAQRAFVSSKSRDAGWFTHIFRRMPQALLRFTGEVVYPHLS